VTSHGSRIAQCGRASERHLTRQALARPVGAHQEAQRAAQAGAAYERRMVAAAERRLVIHRESTGQPLISDELRYVVVENRE